MTLDEARHALVEAFTAKQDAERAYAKDPTYQTRFRVEMATADLWVAEKRFNAVSGREQHEQRVESFGRGQYTETTT